MKNIDITDPKPELVKLFSYKEWRQHIHLYDEIYSPGTRTEYEWDMCHLPASLRNKTFIDVGSNDGMFSFLAESKGAVSVKSVDLYIDENHTGFNMVNGWPINRIKDIKKLKNSSLDVQACSIYNLKSLDQQFDITFCGNVIAWLTDPATAIDQLSAITKEKLIIREDISMVKGKPVLEYVNNKELTGCSFNGNEAFYRMRLLSNGFKKIEIIPVDEYKIFEMRTKDYKKYSVSKGTKIYTNPFSGSDFVLLDKAIQAQGAALINKKYFLNNYGWVEMENVMPLPEMIPANPIKRELFKKRFKKNMVQNCMIFAEK